LIPHQHLRTPHTVQWTPPMQVRIPFPKTSWPLRGSPLPSFRPSSLSLMTRPQKWILWDICRIRSIRSV